MKNGVHRQRILFQPGVIVITQGAREALSQDDVLNSLVRHFGGDWGELDKQDWEENNRALKSGHRLFSQYFTPEARKFWVITEHDRSATTILLPQEY